MFRMNAPQASRLARSAVVALAFALSVLASPLPAQAQSTSANSADPPTPVEEFSRQLDQLKSTFADLSKKIEERARTIDQQTNVQESRKEIAELRAMVSSLLGAVADNGEVAMLGAKALQHAQNKLKALREETRYTPEQREFLTHEWEKLARETEAATAELERARVRFAGLLRTLQTNDDYIGELVEVRQGTEALKVIRDLAKQIHDASDLLNNFITTLAPPRAGT